MKFEVDFQRRDAEAQRKRENTDDNDGICGNDGIDGILPFPSFAKEARNGEQRFFDTEADGLRKSCLRPAKVVGTTWGSRAYDLPKSCLRPAKVVPTTSASRAYDP